MGIELVKVEGKDEIAPLIMCDQCNLPIWTEGNALYLWNSEHGLDSSPRVLFTHKTCNYSLELKIEEFKRDDQLVKSENIDTFLRQLSCNFSNPMEEQAWRGGYTAREVYGNWKRFDLLSLCNIVRPD